MLSLKNKKNFLPRSSTGPKKLNCSKGLFSQPVQHKFNVKRNLSSLPKNNPFNTIQLQKPRPPTVFRHHTKPLIQKVNFCSKHPLGWTTANKQGFEVADYNNNKLRATTVLCVRRNGQVVMMADGQVTAGDHIVKSSVKKLRTMADGKVIGGFAGSVSDAVTLSETLENKLEEYRGQLLRACVEMSKMWRTDKFLRKLEATIIVADKDKTLRISGDGNVFEHDDICAIGSGGLYAYSSALALLRETDMTAEQIAEKSMKIAGDICIYTNNENTKLKLEPEEASQQE